MLLNMIVVCHFYNNLNILDDFNVLDVLDGFDIFGGLYKSKLTSLLLTSL